MRWSTASKGASRRRETPKRDISLSGHSMGHLLSYSLSGGHDGTMLPINPRGLNGPLTSHFIFSCDQAALWMVFSVRLSVCPSVCPSVRLSVCPSVRLSHLFDYVPIIVSSWNFQELSHWTRVRSMQKVKVRGQRSRSQRSRPKFSFPDCNSSLNSHMMMKWYI